MTKKIKPVKAWKMWCVFMHGQPMLSTLTAYEWDAKNAAERWTVRALDQIGEVRELAIRVLPKRKKVSR